ncbi:SLC13 family permease [Nonomuraea sp. NPDC004186]
MSVLAWLSVAVFLGAYALIATERIHRVAAPLGGAGLMLPIHASDAGAALFSEQTGVDWNVIFLLLGMMVIVSVLKQTGVFEYLAIWAAKRARGRPYRLMVLLVVITAEALASNRRQIKTQANLQEGRHDLARKIFHGRRGQLNNRYLGLLARSRRSKLDDLVRHVRHVDRR